MQTIPVSVLQSARITANAHGRAYIGITRSVADWGAGGKWHVTSVEGHPHWSGMPVVWAATIDDDGVVTIADNRFSA